MSRVREEDIETFFQRRIAENSASGQPLDPSTFNAYLRVLRLFFDWAVKKGLTDFDPVDVRMKKVPVKERFRLPVIKFQALLDACDRPRDRIGCALGIYLWSRQAELCDIQWKHVDLDQGKILVYIHKTNDIDSMPITRYLRKEILTWMDFYRRATGVEELDPEWYVIPHLQRGGLWRRGADGERIPLPPRLVPDKKLLSITEAAQRPLARLGYNTYGEGIHTLRRSGARAFFDEWEPKIGYGKTIKYIMLELHHTRMETTEGYLGIRFDVRERDNLLRDADMFGEDELHTESPINVVSLAERRKRNA